MQKFLPRIRDLQVKSPRKKKKKFLARNILCNMFEILKYLLIQNFKASNFMARDYKMTKKLVN